MTMPDTSSEPERFKGKTRIQLEHWIDSLTIESQRHRAGKKYWKEYARRLERKLDEPYNKNQRS